jgi:hypothetical protein
MKNRNKKAAIELSMATIVVLVIAMSMLILGLVLVRTIFSGAKYNVEQMNKKVEAEIGKLFAEDKPVILYLPNNLAEMQQGKVFNLAFGIKNFEKTQKLKWTTEVQDDNIAKKCGIKETDAQKWISTGGSGNADIKSGQSYYDTILFNIPAGEVSDVSTCIVKFRLVVKNEDGSPYTTAPFNVQVSG